MVVVEEKQGAFIAEIAHDGHAKNEMQRVKTTLIAEE
jgi:hypothetical protein